MRGHIEKLKVKTHNFLRWSEQYTKTDMVYLAKGGFWLTTGQVISSLSSFALALCFANLVTKEILGIYQYVLSISGILAISTLSGVNTALIQGIANGFEGNLIQAIKTKIKWGVIGSMSSVLLAGYYFIQDNITLGISFLIVSLFLPFMDSFGVYDSYFQGKKMFEISTRYRVLSQIIAVSAMISTLLLTKNIFIIIFVYFISWTSLRFLFLKIMIKKFEINKNTDPQIISFGKHLSIMDIFQSVAGYADKILTFHYLGAIDLAIYTIASAPISQIKSFIQNIKILALPKLSSADTSDIKKYLPQKILKAELLIALIVLTYIIAAPFLIPLFFPQYTNSIKLSQIISLTLLAVPRTLLSTGLSAKKQIKSLYQIRVFGPAGKLIIYFILIKTYGLFGLAFGRVITEFYLIWLYNFYFKKIK